MPKSMDRRVFLRKSVNLLGFVGLSLVGCSSANHDSTSTDSQTPSDTTTMNLESQAFDANEMIPSQYTCDGEEISPELHWDAPPTGTQSLALIVDDPDAPGQTFVHWVVYDISRVCCTTPKPLSIKALSSMDIGSFSRT